MWLWGRWFATTINWQKPCFLRNMPVEQYLVRNDDGLILLFTAQEMRDLMRIMTKVAKRVRQIVRRDVGESEADGDLEEAAFGEIDEVRLHAPLGDEALRLPRVGALLHAEDLDFHARSLSSV